MAEHHDNDKRPHGETGDTVQQAAEVSRPTTTVGHAIDNSKVPQAPLDPKTWGATDGNTDAGGSPGGTGPALRDDT